MYSIVIQYALEDKTKAPTRTLLRRWTKATLSEQLDTAEITVRIVDVDEMATLNASYRHKQGPTNVLSFPFAGPDYVTLEQPILGDIVICADVVNQEALEQQKSAEAHWAHMIVHGIFHLLGHDHETDEEAAVMEALEINMMKKLGFENPYENRDDYE